MCSNYDKKVADVYCLMHIYFLQPSYQPYQLAYISFLKRMLVFSVSLEIPTNKRAIALTQTVPLGLALPFLTR